MRIRTITAGAREADPERAADAAREARGRRGAAGATVAIGATTPGGLGNMRFAALAGVAPGSPFLPAAYHDGVAPWNAVGPEAAALAIQATADCRLQNGDRGWQQSAIYNLQSA